MKLPKNKKKIILLSSLAVIVIAGAVGGFVLRERIIATMGTTTTSKTGGIVTEYTPSKKELTEIKDRKRPNDPANKKDAATLGASDQTTSSTRTDSAATQNSTYTKPTPRSATCNESLKKSYTTDYNKKVTAEKERWDAVLERIAAEAESKGLDSDTYVATQTKKQLPYHTASLTNLKTAYQAKMKAINCTK